MKNLSSNWITEGIIDFEHKKYVLLAYLQHVSANFDEKKLYPFLSDLITHYRSLLHLQEKKQQVKQFFPKKVRKIDIENFKIEYEQIMHDNTALHEIETILNFAIPRLQKAMGNGKNIYTQVESVLTIEPVGILPIQSDEGYLLISNGNNKSTQVFNYQLSIFMGVQETFRAIRTRFLRSYLPKFNNTYQSIKLDLIKTRRNLPNPATFVAHCQHSFPLHETLLPVAKRSLVRYISRL